jgi:ProP effector
MPRNCAWRCGCIRHRHAISRRCRPAGERFDLDGQAAGEVTAEQREVAATTLRERFKKQAERRKAEEQAKKAAQEEQEAQRKRQEKLAQLAARFNAR